MATHDELVVEMPKLEKLSNAARLKHAKKRRQKQIKKWQEWVRVDRATGGSIARKRTNPSIGIEEGSLLNDMVSRNDVIGVEKLLHGGVDPNISNADGLTPLHKCCIDNTVELAEVLVDHGADLNARDIEGWTPLHAASATGNVTMINLLLDNGASLVTINHDDKMPIDVAFDSDIKYILQQRMLEAGYTDDVLEYIRVSVPKTMLADLKDSAKHGRSLNLQDKYGASALHVAAANGYTEVLDFLLSQEVNLDIQDNEGWTPFHAAVCWGQQEAMRLLAEKGANLDIKNLHGETAYAIGEDPEIRQYVLELKGEFGEEQVVQMDEPMKKGRRMSVKRISQKEKDEMTKESVKEEAMIRRESMAQRPGGTASQSEESEIMRQLGPGEIPGDDDEALVRLLSISSKSGGNGAQPSLVSQVSANGPESPGGESSTKFQNSIKKLESFDVDDSLFRRPQRSVLKPTPPSPVTTYVTTTAAPSSPTGSAGARKSSAGCCTIM